MGLIDEVKRKLDEIHISESEMRELTQQPVNPAIADDFLRQIVFEENNVAWSVTAACGPSQGLKWKIIDVTAAENRTGVGTGLAVAMEANFGYGWGFFGPLCLSSAAGGAPNRGTTALYGDGLMPFTLYPGQTMRVWTAPGGPAKVTIITYSEVPI